MFNKFALAAFGAVALLASVPAEAKSLKGDAFITAMDGNTLYRQDGRRDALQALLPARWPGHHPGRDPPSRCPAPGPSTRAATFA